MAAAPRPKKAPPGIEALGVIELASIARGVVVVDAMVKKAPVTIHSTRPVSPGKHVIVAVGGVAEIEEAMAAGLEAAGDRLVDRLLLPHVHPQLPPRLDGTAATHPGYDSVGVLEVASVAGTLAAADAALKAADVTLVELRLAVGIGGKGYFSLSGKLEEIQAAAEAGQGAITPAAIVGVEIVPAPHEDLRDKLFW